MNQPDSEIIDAIKHFLDQRGDLMAIQIQLAQVIDAVIGGKRTDGSYSDEMCVLHGLLSGKIKYVVCRVSKEDSLKAAQFVKDQWADWASQQGFTWHECNKIRKAELMPEES